MGGHGSGNIYKSWSGRTFGYWTVLKRSVTDRRRHLCRCECGVVKEVWNQSLSSGRSISCGCKTKGRTVRSSEWHGMSNTPEYRSYQAMLQRCYYAKHNRYHSHGGRGIKVCPQWRYSFEQFYADMGPRPKGTSLEREDNDGDYSPDNCRWATPVEQAANTRSAKLVTINGITDTQAGWARRVGITPPTLTKRLKRGWSIEKALGFA